MALFSRRSSKPTSKAAARLYRQAVDQARQPAFFAAAGVSDTLDGRFEMLALHVFLLLHRLKGEAALAPVAQELADLLIADIDANLRELGAGDLGVGRRVRGMASAFYGRCAAYETGLTGAPGGLEAALARNVYRGAAPPGAAPAMAAYLRRAVRRLAAETHAALASGRADFGPAALDGEVDGGD